MDRWVLDGDSYSFLRSAPRPFNLQNREGPNRVEIFDITTVPSHRSAISETTCLCDIFGDDCDSPSLSSSPASTTFLKREDDRPFPVDDANDSSGSYHTASGSDSGDATEVTYATPSPKNIKDFPTYDTRESDSSPIESSIFPDSKNELNPPHCPPPVTHVNSDDLSHPHWEEPQVSTSLVNVTEKMNMSETQDLTSTVDTSLITSSKESLEESESSFHEHGETITTPEHTNTSPFLDYMVSSENTEGEDLPQHMANSRSPSELSNASQTDNNSSPIQNMCTSNCDIDCISVPTLTPEHVISSVIEEISPTPISLGKSSPALLNLSQCENPSDFQPAVSTVFTETQQPVCSTDAREINDICSSSDVQSPADSPELIIIHSPMGYTISSSPTNDTSVYSPEPDASSSPPVTTEIDRSEISSSCDLSASTHSPEPVMIHSPQSYSSYSSPINEREVYSTEPDASPSSPVITGIDSSDICSSPDLSIPAHSPEPEIIHSSIDYAISPSPMNERKVYSVEHDDLPSSPVDLPSSPVDLPSSPVDLPSSPVDLPSSPVDLPSSPVTGMEHEVTPIYSRESTPELRSITSTPNSTHNYLTPEPTSPAPSLDLRSITYSPEIKTISCSVLPQYTQSPAFGEITNSAVSPSEDLTSEVDITVCGDYSETSNSVLGDDASVSPTSRICLSTPCSMSRPTSAASDHTRDTALSPDLQAALEPSISLEQVESEPLPIICDGLNLSSPSPTESRHCDDIADTEIFEQATSDLDECNETEPLLQVSTPSPTSVLQIENSQEIVSDETTDLNIEFVEIKQCHLEVYDSNNETEITKNDTVSGDKECSQVPMTLSVSPGVICGEYDGEKEESGKREGEGVETMGESSYRGEQVELSFSARNRKVPADHSPAPSRQDPKSGISARCYFESHPTTLQQQSQLRAQSGQQENKGGARRVQSAVQGKRSGAGFLTTEPLGENSSMGSEFDEADNEVKWFTDLAFRSLSSPQVDYLDVYNSSHRSSTNVSQPSTNVDSPGAVAWMTYADLRGSTLHENDEPSFVPHDSLIPAKRFEMESFECVDVALETKEESSRRKRTVPKRQIQLLRRSTDESKPKPDTENVLDSLSTQKASKDILVRQHSTPAFVQEEMPREERASPLTDRKRAFQKSLSLDDASPKTQMASCIIKNVLSKKMQDAQKETSGNIDPSPTGDTNRYPDVSSFDSVHSSMEKQSLSSSQHSECTLSSEDMAVREERSPHHQLKKCAPKVPPKPNFRPAFINNGKAEITRGETRLKVAPPFKDKALVNPNSKNDKEARVDNLEEQFNRNTTNAAVDAQTVKMQSRMTSRDTELQMTQEERKQHGGKSVFMSKTPEITLKPSTIKEKKMSSPKVSPDIERSGEMCEYQSMKKAAEDVEAIEMSNDDDNKTKSVIHRVRDVRKLVKNTYNLSFKASNSTSTAEDVLIQEKTEKPPQTPPALHIEYKAISWKDKQTGSKTILCQGETQAVDISKISQPQPATETSRDTDITEITSKASLPTIPSPDSQCTTSGGLNEPDKITERFSAPCERSTTQEMPPRPPSKDREVSALMVLQDGTSKAIQNSKQITSTSSSHSVSMLLKEKGMQADIGVCDVTDDVTAKHINRLEIPLQACVSEAHTGNTALACRLTTSDNSSSKTTYSQDGSKLKPKEQSESAKGTMAEEFSTQQEKTKLYATTNLTLSGKPEVRSITSNIKNNAMPSTASKEIELPIQVRSISSDRVKPFVPPKPSYKQSFAEIKSMSSDPPKPDTQTTSGTKQQTKLTNELKKNEIPATLIHKGEVLSNNTKRLAVSAVSSCKPPPIPVTTTTPSFVQKPTTFASVDQQQSTSTSQQLTTSFIQDHSILASSFASNPSIKPTASQSYSQTQPVTRASSHNRFHTEDYRFYASDDPPSYDERESFSPVQVSDLSPQRLCRFHPNTKQSACSCTQTSHSNQGHPQGRTPPAAQSPGQVLTSLGALPQAQVRPHQCRPDSQALNYLPISTNTTAPHASALIQPLHHSRVCPVPNIQSYGDDHLPPSGPHTDRRPANHHSPQAVGPASYHEYAHSANMSTVDPRPQLFNPQELPPSFGHDYGNEGPGGASVLYPENAGGIGCGQAPRRVLLDPDTGKYFYIEVPMQPLRKMLFDPELGQYVEVLIPQQAMSHSGLYPPAAPPYSSLHNPGLYAPQYLPYAVPSYPAIPGNAQQVRHPEAAPVPTTLHQRYEGPANQMPKNEPKSHSTLDQGYLESMYYIPTGINASPNSTPLDCYHKPSSSLPPSGGRRNVDEQDPPGFIRTARFLSSDEESGDDHIWTLPAMTSARGADMSEPAETRLTCKYDEPGKFWTAFQSRESVTDVREHPACPGRSFPTPPNTSP